MKVLVSSVLAFLALPHALSYAGCLDEVRKFATEICGAIQDSGRRDLLDVSGNLNAEVSGIVRRVVGGGSGNLDIRNLTDIYEGVLRKDLAAERFNARECRVKMVEVARKEACKKKVTYRTCRHSDFGRVSWKRKETVSQQSGWRSGGHSWDDWCDEIITGFVSSRALGGNYETGSFTGWEESNKDWKGHVTYNYLCTVEISFSPLYAKRTDPRCGVLN